MLLPIVLLLATANPTQQANKATALPQNAAVEPSALVEQTATSNPGQNRFVNPGQARRLPRTPLYDKGIIVPKNPCLADHTCETGCLSITAYVFSDGETPELKYVTDCPNLDAPYQSKRAHHDVPPSEQHPVLKRRN
jgi:hypothetical protein